MGTFTELRWDPDRRLWTLNARTVPKTSAEVVQALVGPLGEYAVEGADGSSEQVGVINDEQQSESILIVSRGRGLFDFV